MTRVLRALAAALALAACGHGGAGAPSGEERAKVRADADAGVVANQAPDGAAEESSMPTITSKDGIAGHDGQEVQVVGVYQVQDLGRYKIISTLPDGTEVQSNKLAYLKLDDGSSVRLGVRPEDERSRLTDQRVIATGTLREQWPPPQDPSIAQPNAKPTLVVVQSVEPLP